MRGAEVRELVGVVGVLFHAVRGDGSFRDDRERRVERAVGQAAAVRKAARLRRVVPQEIGEQLEIDARYAGYLERQEADIRAFRKDEALELPNELDYGSVGSLSAEIRSKLQEAKPATLGAAARISGVTPAALIALLKHVRRRESRSAA